MAITSRVTKLISSPMTKRNPRPRKYASQAERQAAYRARNVMLEFRAEPKTADNITKIADTLGYPRSDVLLSMVKFALTNHDWARFGLTHKTIPTYKENPMQSWMIVNKQTGEAVLETYNKDILSKLNTAKYEAIPALKYLVALNKKIKENPTMKPASPAQLAARKRFAEMARSGAFKKATKRKTNPTKNETIFKTGDMVTTDKGELGQVSYKKVQPGGYADVYKLLDVKANDPYKSTFLENGNFINGTRLKKATKRKANPTMRPIIKAATNIRELAYDLENISQDDKKQISDYTDAEILHEAKYVLEIYQESGTVSNDALMGEHGKDEQKSARDDVRKLKALIKKFGATTPRKTNPAKKTVSQKISQLVHEGYPQRQAVAVALSEQRAGKVKRNPSKRTYEVYCQSPGMNINSWTKLATFFSAEKAKQYAKTYAKAYPSHYVRVESHG